MRRAPAPVHLVGEAEKPSVDLDRFVDVVDDVADADGRVARLRPLKESRPPARNSKHDRARGEPDPGQVPAGAVGRMQRRRLARPASGRFGEIRITRLEPETAVAWEGERASGTVRLEPSGWGTRVTLTAQSGGGRGGRRGGGPSRRPVAEAEQEPEPVVPEPESGVEPEPVRGAGRRTPPPAQRLEFLARGSGAVRRAPGAGRAAGRRAEPEPDSIAAGAEPVPEPEPSPRPIPTRSRPEPEPSRIPPAPDPTPASPHRRPRQPWPAHHRPFSRA